MNQLVLIKVLALSRAHKSMEDLLTRLPNDVLVSIGSHVLGADLPCALGLCQISRRLRDVLSATLAEQAEARRLRWIAKYTVGHEIVDGDCRTLQRTPGPQNSTAAWAVGPVLPTSGCSSWALRILQSAGNRGSMFIGVCDARCECYWGLYPHTGEILRGTRSRHTGEATNAPPPAGYPDGHRQRVLFDESGNPASLHGHASGSTVEVHLDHDAGTLSFSINRGRRFHALSGFPPGAALRPWVRCIKQCSTVPKDAPALLACLRFCADDGDRICLVRPYL